MSSRTCALWSVTGALCFTAFAVSATAADLTAPFDPGPALQQKVEFGTGWYIRGDLGFERTNFISTPSVVTAGSTPPNVLLNSGHTNSYTAGIGGGYVFNNWIRADAIVETRRPLDAQLNGPLQPNACLSGFTAGGAAVGESCSPVSKTSVSRYDALANVYVDLGTWYGFTPYIGGGVGAAFGREHGATNWYQTDGTSYNLYVTDTVTNSTVHAYQDASASKTYVNFAWAAMAGVSYDLTDRLKLDVGYRYFNAGHLSGLNATGATGSMSLISQDVRAGLRYLID